MNAARIVTWSAFAAFALLLVTDDTIDRNAIIESIGAHFGGIAAVVAIGLVVVLTRSRT